MAAALSTKTLSFDEILPGNSVRITEDKLIYAIDLVMVITGENKVQASSINMIEISRNIIGVPMLPSCQTTRPINLLPVNSTDKPFTRQLDR